MRLSTNPCDRAGTKATICNINNFSIVTGIYKKYYCTQLSCTKTAMEKFSFTELKIEKIRCFTESPTKHFCISVFNVGGCFASCLTFRPFKTLDP